MQPRRFFCAQAPVLCVLGFLAFLSTTAQAGEFPVSGNHDFVRGNGKPALQQIGFTAPVAGDYYRLRIYNGEGAASAVTSASVTLNGVEVFAPKDFKKKTGFLEASVSLQLQNSLAVTLAGKPGSGLRIEVIGIDNDKPTITAAIDPEANAAGWHNVDATVTFTCSDDLSGIENCSEPVRVSDEGADRKVSGAAVDRAGNTATTEVAVSLDKTAPQLSADITPPANAAGWHRQTATITYRCTDSLSGVATCPESKQVSDEGADQLVAASVTDIAGNSAQIQNSVSLDLTPPEIATNIAPSANEAGWHKSAVTLDYQCSDNLSGIAECPAQDTVSGQGAGQEVVVTAMDIAGNSASSSAQLNIDITAPTIEAQLSAPVNAAGWHSAPVTVSYQCSDDLSGIASCPQAQTLAGDGAGQTISASATDLAGNSATAGVTVNLDQTPPEVSFISPTDGSLLRESQPQLKLLVSDNLALDSDSLQVSVDGSAIDSCSLAANIATCALAEPLSADAVISLAASVRDMAGNSGSSEVSTAIDSDGDTVADYADQCAGTAPTENANTEGCALSQLDSDDDGVNDAEEIAAGSDPEDDSSFPPVVINSFGASPSAIDNKGQQVELRWQVQGASSVEIMSDSGESAQTGLGNFGQLQINPQITTRYTLIARGPAGDTSQSVTVSLELPPPPQRWTTPSIPVQDQIATSLAVADDGSAYVGAFDGNFYKVDASGQVAWILENTGVVMGKAAIAGDRIIFGANVSGSGHLDESGRVYALSPEKNLLWKFDTAGAVVAGPLLNADKSVAYVATYSGSIYALDSQSGAQLWYFQLPDKQSISARPVLVGQKLIVHTEEKNLIALSVVAQPTSDRILWSRDLD